MCILLYHTWPPLIITAKGVSLLKYRSSEFDEIDIVLNVDDE